MALSCGGAGTGGDAGDVPNVPDAPSSDAGCPTGVAASRGVAVTDRGAVRGIARGATYAYLGVPYAAPPVGALRWRPPGPAACWPDVRDATAFGSICPQLDANGAVVGDEDCLTLNVWTPATATATSSLPVLFFVHGGGNSQGSSAVTVAASGAYIYDGEYVATRGPAVVVTINYRIGALGFLAHPALTAEGGRSSGNYGLRDQIAALGWVHRNIAAFGGDPSRVLVFGESAGALDACDLLTAPSAAGLFHRALLESGSCVATPLATAETIGTQRVAASTPCGSAGNVLDCLRAIPAAMVVTQLPGAVSVAMGSGTEGFGPVVDGDVLPADPLTALTSGQFTRVPVVVGVNANETSRAVPTLSDDAAYAAAVQAWVGAALAPRVVAQYPAAAFPNPTAAFVAATTDARFVCPARRVARAVAPHAPVYRYLFAHALDSTMARMYGAWHGLEVLWVFHSLTAVPLYTPSAPELALSDAMIDYWTRFAASGDPNDGTATTWPRYDVATDAYIRLDNAVTSGAGLRTAECDFWDGLLGR
jgi:para-nitrobenzyl esterase